MSKLPSDGLRFAVYVDGTDIKTLDSLRGADGKTGDTGPRGEMGPTGSRGAGGEIGPQGPRGDRGPIGLSGPTGPKGDTGPKGETVGMQPGSMVFWLEDTLPTGWEYAPITLPAWWDALFAPKKAARLIQKV